MWFSSCANQDQEHFHTHLTKGLVRVNSGLCRNWLGLHRWSCCRRAALLNNEVPSHVNKTTQIFLHMFENTVLFPSSLIHSNLQRLKHFPEYFVFFLLLFLRWGDSSGSIVVSFWGIETKTGIFLKRKKKKKGRFHTACAKGTKLLPRHLSLNKRGDLGFHISAEKINVAPPPPLSHCSAGRKRNNCCSLGFGHCSLFLPLTSQRIHTSTEPSTQHTEVVPWQAGIWGKSS